MRTEGMKSERRRGGLGGSSQGERLERMQNWQQEQQRQTRQLQEHPQAGFQQQQEEASKESFPGVPLVENA